MDGSGRMGTRPAGLLAVTPVILLATHAAAVLAHVLAHSLAAWALGLGPHPLAIDWKVTSPADLLLLRGLGDGVDYQAALAAGKDWQVAVVAVAGIVANGALYLACHAGIGRPMRPLAAWVLMWFLFMNLVALFDYVPLRPHQPDADLVHLRQAVGLPPWPVYGLVGYAVIHGFIGFYRRVLPAGLDAARIFPPGDRAVILVLVTAILFALAALPGLVAPDPVTQVMMWMACILFPLILLLAWRRVVTGTNGGRRAI